MALIERVVNGIRELNRSGEVSLLKVIVLAALFLYLIHVWRKYGGAVRPWLKRQSTHLFREKKGGGAGREEVGSREQAQVLEDIDETLRELPLSELRDLYERNKNVSERGVPVLKALLERSSDLFDDWFEQQVSHEHHELLCAYRLERLPCEEAMACVRGWVKDVDMSRVQPLIFLERLLYRPHALWQEEAFRELFHREVDRILERYPETFQRLLDRGDFSEVGEEALREHAFLLCGRAAAQCLPLPLRLELYEHHPAGTFSREFFDELMRSVPFPQSLKIVEHAREAYPELTELSALEATMRSSFLLHKVARDEELFVMASNHVLERRGMVEACVGEMGQQFDTIVVGLLRSTAQYDGDLPSYQNTRRALLEAYVQFAVRVPDRTQHTLQVLHMLLDEASSKEERERYARSRDELIEASGLLMHRGTVTLVTEESQQVGGLTRVEEASTAGRE